MELKKSIFSRLFGSKAEDTPAEEEESFLPDLPPEPPAAGPTPRHELILPEDHAIFKLWVLRRDGAGWLSKPELCLEGENDPIMPDDEGKKELLRLQPVINASASARYDKARTRTQDGMDIPPSDLDAEVVIFLSRDGLTAWLLAYPPVGLGNDLNIGILKSSLDSFHVTHGVDQELLHALPKDPDRYFHLFVIARGTPMIPGLHGRVVDLFPRVEERKLTVDENNRVDFTELNFIHNVEQGGVICQIFPATEGTPGITVQDQPIPIRPGKPVVIPQGRNTEVSEDGQALIASIAGHVEFSGRGFQVKPVLDIPGNVDFSVGDISFLGDVCVHGDICSGFTVRATGSITVGGVVEACIVEAGRERLRQISGEQLRLRQGEYRGRVHHQLQRLLRRLRADSRGAGQHHRRADPVRPGDQRQHCGLPSGQPDRRHAGRPALRGLRRGHPDPGDQGAGADPDPDRASARQPRKKWPYRQAAHADSGDQEQAGPEP